MGKNVVNVALTLNLEVLQATEVVTTQRRKVFQFFKAIKNNFFS